MRLEATPKDVMTDLGFDIDHQYLEDLERLGLVLD